MTHPLAGKPAPRNMLVDVPDLLRRYDAERDHDDLGREDEVGLDRAGDLLGGSELDVADEFPLAAVGRVAAAVRLASDRDPAKQKLGSILLANRRRRLDHNMWRMVTRSLIR